MDLPSWLLVRGCNSVGLGPGAAGTPQAVPTVLPADLMEDQWLFFPRQWRLPSNPGISGHGPQFHLPLPYSPASCRADILQSYLHLSKYKDLSCPIGTSEFLGFVFSSKSHRQLKNTPSPSCGCRRRPRGSRRRQLGSGPPNTPDVGGDAPGSRGCGRVNAQLHWEKQLLPFHPGTRKHGHRQLSKCIALGCRLTMSGFRHRGCSMVTVRGPSPATLWILKG